MNKPERTVQADEEWIRTLEQIIHSMDDKLEKINKVIEMAEDWSDKQLLPETTICMAALKDIRTIMRKK